MHVGMAYWHEFVDVDVLLAYLWEQDYTYPAFVIDADAAVCRYVLCSMAALFITMTFLGTSNSSGVQPIVSIERPVFYRERAAGG
jgi:hypothetical protein